jgi:hypothetical protein
VKAGAFYGHFNSGLGVGGLFLLAVDLCTRALLDELVCLPLIGVGGTTLRAFFFISLVADL